MASLALCDLQGTDRRFVADLIEILVQPERQRTAAAVRAGNFGLRYRLTDGAVVITPISVHSPRSCRKCGCTDMAACYDHRTGMPCYWVGPRLCSACAPLPERAMSESDRRRRRAKGRKRKR